MSLLLNQLFTGVSVGAVLLLIALGLVLTFGQMNVINMAHGELIMLGAYTVFVVQKGISSAGVSLMLSLPIAFLVAGAVGILLEVTLIRRLYGRPLDTLLVTWGVSLVLQQAARDIFGATGVQTQTPSWLTGSFDVGPVTVATSRLFILVLALVAVFLLTLGLRMTPLGRRIRAVVQSRALASTSGIPTGRIDRTTFFIGSGLAGIAGVALSMLGSISPTMGTSYIINAFLVVVVGGLAELRGTVIVAFVLGMLNAFIELKTSASIASVVVFLLIVVFLQWRPQGLYALKTRSLV